MRRLKLFFAKLVQSLRWSNRPRREAFLLSSIDPDEFSCLLRSGRKQDLETLAKKLSEHPSASRVPMSVRPQHDAPTSKGRDAPK